VSRAKLSQSLCLPLHRAVELNNHRSREDCRGELLPQLLLAWTTRSKQAGG